MKAKWIVTGIIAVLLLAGGIGYVTGVLPAWRRASVPKSQAVVSPLRIEEQKDPALGESGVESHRDLRFQSQTDKPLTIRLEATDCACASVRICVVPDEWKTLHSPTFLERAADPTLAWQSLKKRETSFTVPPGKSGLIRVTWKTLKVGAASLGIDLSVDDGANKITQRFDVPVNFIAPVWLGAEGDLNANEAEIGRLKAGTEQAAHFLCCSTTRKTFAFSPAPPSDDPCIVYGPPQALSSAEVQALPTAPDGRSVLSAFRVRITVREQAGDNRLDLGPLHRLIVYTTELAPDLKLSGYVNGSVEGEVRLASSEGKDFVDLGSVLPTQPQPVTFTLEGCDPKLRLAVDEQRTVDFLKVELLDGQEGKPIENGKRWGVRVAYRTDALFRGPIPNPNNAGYVTAKQCSVVFLLSRPGAASSVRRLFVPVRGTVGRY